MLAKPQDGYESWNSGLVRILKQGVTTREDGLQPIWLATPELANGSFVVVLSMLILATAGAHGDDCKPCQLNTGYLTLHRSDVRTSGAPGIQSAGASFSPRSSDTPSACLVRGRELDHSKRALGT